MNENNEITELNCVPCKINCPRSRDTIKADLQPALGCNPLAEKRGRESVKGRSCFSSKKASPAELQLPLSRKITLIFEDFFFSSYFPPAALFLEALAWNIRRHSSPPPWAAEADLGEGVSLPSLPLRAPPSSPTPSYPDHSGYFL